MVVLSASICTGGGKALVSRQFVEMNRLRVEGLLAAFPKLVGHAKQHTFVDTDSVRYIYQPLENHMFLLLITTKGSNIVEDLGTLRLLAKVVPEVAGGLSENHINESAFDLIFAFDEVLTAGGYTEEASLSSIRTNLEMDSHEEKVATALKEAKEAEAKKKMQDNAKNLQKQRMEQMRQNLMTGQTGAPAPGGMVGFGGGGPQQGDMFGGQGFGGDAGGYDAYQRQQQGFQQPQQPAEPEPPKVVAKGMKLGGMGAAGKKDKLMEAMVSEDNLGFGSSNADPFGLAAPVAAPAPKVASTPLTLALEEKISVNMNREGGVEACEVKGTLTLTANTDAGAAAIVEVNKAALPSNFNFATHPKVNKQTYEKSGVLSLKKGGFPLNRPVGVLRWSYGGEDAAPITVNCWPEDEGSGSINVNIEMELTRTDVVLTDVNILLPLGTTDPPVIEAIDGEYKHDPNAGMLCWHFDQIDASNSSGSLEFSIAGADTDAFFPCQVMFKSDTLLCPIQVTNVTSSANGTVVPNTMTKSFVPDTYQCA
mmetsp:Transcript_10664/g.14954  ORF Transcript_10664/g.14954 Transcript_10664/m.14954 type:complete len:536 (+) Transcript_10664:63-1670(+)